MWTIGLWKDDLVYFDDGFIYVVASPGSASRARVMEIELEIAARKQVKDATCGLKFNNSGSL